MSRASLLDDDNVLDVSPFIVNDDEIKAKAEQAEAEAYRNRMLMICFFLMLVFGLGNKIFQILQMIRKCLLSCIASFIRGLGDLTSFFHSSLQR